MKHELIQEIEDKVVKKAISHVDQDKIADLLASKLQKRIEDDFASVIENDLDIAYWIRDELTDEGTKAGKAFTKAIAGITKKMADSIVS